jgi:hypothetical protein
MEVMMTDVLELFNCLVIDEVQRVYRLNYPLIDRGIITDFMPTETQKSMLASIYKPLPLNTFFTREERETASLEHLLVKQFLHYFEVYGLGQPGLFDLTTSSGTVVTMHFVQGITVNELETMVQDLLYTNAPVKDAAQLKRIIDKYCLAFDINRVANNELRVALWHDGLGAFKSGDDAVRFLCYYATGEALLIKSPEVISAISTKHFPPEFFEVHALPLAQVFNRHKRLILAAKGKQTARVINRIARMSKTAHVPIHESIAKTFIHKSLIMNVPADALKHALKHVTVRDKLKYLNLLEQKKIKSTVASFKIRNGKVHTRTDRRVYRLNDINRVQQSVLRSLVHDLSHLVDQNILLDPNVNYGLPISRKQTVGQLPFGTQVISRSNEISSGIYWENAWGASDLDLSTIDMDGNRVGWGTFSGYSDKDIIYSGDKTDAHNGAMEFMTSKTEDYGLFVNIYHGAIGSEMELIVGANKTERDWIDKPLIRERLILKSRETVIGFVRGKTFTVYAGRLSSKRVSGDNPIVNELKSNPWTIQKLFRVLGIDFHVDRDDEIEYNYDLSYDSFSFDKLENMFKAA